MPAFMDVYYGILMYFWTLCYIVGSAFIYVLNWIQFDAFLRSSKGSNTRASRAM